jgi:hypothetical protein
MARTGPARAAFIPLHYGFERNGTESVAFPATFFPTMLHCNNVVF